MSALKQKVVLAYSGGLDTSVILGKSVAVGCLVGGIFGQRYFLEGPIFWPWCTY